MRTELTAALHHSASKSAGPEMHDALRSQKTVNSKDAVFFEFYDDTAGWRPAPLLEPPQRVARHLQRNVDTPLVVLDAPVRPGMRTRCRASTSQWRWSSSFLKECSNALLGVGAVLVSGLAGLEQLVPQERVQQRTGEHVHAFGEPVLLQRVQQLTAEQVAHGFHVPQHRAQQRSEQVVDVHAPLATASERNVQQVVDDLCPLRTSATRNC